MSNQRLITWQREQADLVNNEIERLLVSLSDVSDFSHIIREPLAEIRRMTVTETSSGKPWYLLPLVVCEAILGYYEHAIPASSALQLFMAAGEVFDDIEDADNAESLAAKYGFAIATNAATTLLILAERALSRLKTKGVPDNVVIRVTDAANSFYTVACAGQHLDFSLTSETTVSEDTCLKLAYMKSATNIECACHIGALIATESQEMVNSLSLFGCHIGMASQIANDIQGITRGSDIAKHKITLPVVYALAHTEGEVHNQLNLAFNQPYESVPGNKQEQIQRILFNSGAIQYATIKMEIYRQHALDILHELERERVKTERLKSFLE